MKNCSGIIITPQNYEAYGGLTKTRPDYMIPFAGRYRLIDFALSSMSNFSLYRVMLYAGDNVRSTLDHIGDGKSWELNRRNNGLFINPSSYDSLTHTKSEIQTYFDSISYYENSPAQHIHIINPMTIAKPNLDDAYAEFTDHDYDVMLFYKNVKDNEGNYNGMRKIIFDDNGDLINVGINLSTCPEFPLYIDRMFIKKKVFIELVKNSIEMGNARTLIQAISNHRSVLHIGAYEIKNHIEVIHSIESYYQASMNLLNQDNYNELFFADGLVYTKSKDEPSTLYYESAKVQNSLIANGCIIEGQVENSILFRGVHIKKNAIVRNCVLNEKTVVEENAVVANVITDKNVCIMNSVAIAGAYTHPYMIEKNETVTR
ncbi:MAG: glucose-1-phosphate adenylyltransferase subunit GlgD [Peptoniphilaceae bacterium]|nr:glucose-1-phosphate adenylyltransferase subunit GlgD [Peptoniphilaceae bacterium]